MNSDFKWKPRRNFLHNPPAWALSPDFRGFLNLFDPPKQKVISLYDVQSFIENGWEYVGSLTDDQVIVRTR